MDGFWMEMHCHCATGSGCAKVDPYEIPDLYKQAGYSGIVVTDHFHMEDVTPGSEDEYKQLVDRAVTGYRIMKEIASEDFTVLLGAEFSLATQNDSNHFLVYGLSEDFMYKSSCMPSMSLDELSRYLHENGKMIYQAHPFRGTCYPNNPRYLDGVEAFNDPRSKFGDNLLAEEWADKHNMAKISGSDFHRYSALASGGVCFNHPIKNNEELLKALKAQAYTIKTNYDY